jgi:adenine-specific DNA-methyltransferase
MTGSSIHSTLKLAQQSWRHYPTAVVRWGLVNQWLRVRGFGDYPLKDFGISDRLFAPMASTDLPLARSIEAVFPSMTLKELETSFESIIEYDDKRRSGTVLTPSYIIEYLIQTAIKFYSENTSDIPKICDPACGYAGFLVNAIGHLVSAYSIQPKEAVVKYIYGYDINPDSVEIAKVMMALAVLETGHDPKGLEFGIRCADALLDEPIHMEGYRAVSDGFDVLVTNPPYIKLQNLSSDYRSRLQMAYPKFSIGSYSTAMLFLLAGYRLLSAQGCLGYITQNNLFTSLAAREIRKFIGEQECLKRIVNFGSSRIFEGVGAYTCLLFATAKSSSEFQYGQLNDGADSSSLRSLEYSTIAHTSLNSSKWRLVPGNHKANIERLESVGTPLGSLCDVRVGFATLKDRAFLVRKNGDRVVGTAPDEHEYEIEPEITRAAIKISGFSSEAELESNVQRIVFPYNKIGGKHQPISEESLAEDFPKCSEYLLTWKTALATRGKGRHPTTPWYGWGRIQCMEAPGPKLLTKTFSNRPNFMLDQSDSLFCNGYGVFPKVTGSLFAQGYSLALVQAVINSAIMDYYMRLTSFQIGGDFQCYQKNFIERFSIPSLDAKSAESILEVQNDERDYLLCSIYGLDYADIQGLVSLQA